MNSNEILNKYINLIDKGYCSDCNELNCIDNFPQAKITHAIRKLQQENKQLKDNWNYIKKMLKEARQEEFNITGYCGTCTDVDIDFLLNKMQELEGSDNNGI